MKLLCRINSPRFVLRPLTSSDGDQVVALLNDADLARWLTVVPHPYGRADFDGFLDHIRQSSPLSGLAIEEDGQVLGVVGLDPTLGYWLGRSHHGRGVMTEAATALIDHAFTTENYTEIGSGYFDGNTRSLAVLRKLGFAATGVVEPTHCVSQAKTVPLIKMRLTQDDWQARQ